MLEFEVLEHAESPIGVIILRRRNPPEEHVLELTLEHQFLMSSVVTVSENALATRAIEMHGGSDLDVMVGGLGLGYTCKAALDSDRVAAVEAVELVGELISWVKRGIITLGKELMLDPRFRMTQDDVYGRLHRTPTKTHDLLLIDVDHSPDEPLDPSADNFYMHESLALAKRHLRPNGVFGVWSTSESHWFAEELRKTFEEVRIEPIDFYNVTCDQPETNWLFLAR